MPELSRFFGIIIRMYLEAGGQHSLPHFHAYHQGDQAVFTIDPVGMIEGSFPTGIADWLRHGAKFIRKNCRLHGMRCKAVGCREESNR